MLVIWNLSLFVSLVSLVAGLLKRSWLLLLLSTIASIPIAIYFFGANNTWKFVGIAPVILLGITIGIWYLDKKKSTSQL